MRSLSLAAGFVTIAGMGCGTTTPPDPVVTVTMTTSSSPSGACPQRPGTPTGCPTDLTVIATFHESAGAPALLQDLKLETCRAGTCSEGRQLDPLPSAQGHRLTALTSLSVRFGRLYSSSAPPDHVVVTATVVGRTVSYPVRAEQ